jgi:hypothetical protein
LYRVGDEFGFLFFDSADLTTLVIDAEDHVDKFIELNNRSTVRLAQDLLAKDEVTNLGLYKTRVP